MVDVLRLGRAVVVVGFAANGCQVVVERSVGPVVVDCVVILVVERVVGRVVVYRVVGVAAVERVVRLVERVV